MYIIITTFVYFFFTLNVHKASTAHTVNARMIIVSDLNAYRITEDTRHGYGESTNPFGSQKPPSSVRRDDPRLSTQI